jgi:thiol-disulfide isomerase/thioredoxin
MYPEVVNVANRLRRCGCDCCVGACRLRGDATPGSATGVNGTPVAATSAVPQTLAFTAHTVGGKRFDAASLAGKPVVLWFWAAWCPRRRAAAMT